MSSTSRNGLDDGSFEALRMDGDGLRRKLDSHTPVPFSKDAAPSSSSGVSSAPRGSVDAGFISGVVSSFLSDPPLRKKSSECSLSSETNGPVRRRSTGLTPEAAGKLQGNFIRRNVSSEWALSSGEDFNFEEVGTGEGRWLR